MAPVVGLSALSFAFSILFLVFFRKREKKNRYFSDLESISSNNIPENGKPHPSLRSTVFETLVVPGKDDFKSLPNSGTGLVTDSGVDFSNWDGNNITVDNGLVTEKTKVNEAQTKGFSFLNPFTLLRTFYPSLLSS